MKFVVAVLMLVACAVAVFAVEEAPKEKRAIAGLGYSGLGYGAYPYAGGYGAYPYAAGYGAAYGGYPYAAGYGLGGYPYYG